MARRGRLFRVLTFTITGGKIAQVNVVAHPERLRQLDLGGPQRSLTERAIVDRLWKSWLKLNAPESMPYHMEIMEFREKHWLLRKIWLPDLSTSL
jgi:hypothetical protein